MNTKNILQGFLVILIISLVSCTKGFEEINTDPNRIEKISPGTLLTPILYEMATFYTERSDGFTFHIMQVKVPFPSASGGIHRFDITPNTGNSLWNNSYRWLNNIKEMYGASVEAEDVNYQAIALTLNAWIYSNLTDAFGDVPMTEAVRGEEGILQPAFDTQQAIYTKLLDDLDAANNLYDTDVEMIYGTEILYENDVLKWKKFTNSLRMRLLLRVSNRPEMNSWTRLREMVDNPTQYPVFTQNSDGAIMQVSGITPNESPWGRAIDFTTFMATAEFFLDNLNDWDDPRRAKFATLSRTTDGAPTDLYRGIPSGYDNENDFGFLPSNMNIQLVTAPMVLVIMPYAEVEFIKAELENHQEQHGPAKTAYEKGVKAAIEQWGAAMPADYFDNPLAAYDESLERIMLQKYYALFFVDYQQWFEYRRTGFPELPVGETMLNDGKVPTRFFYPTVVQTNNATNYNQAVANMGGDDINTMVWWEK